jgi:protein SCO1/2
MNPFPLAAAKKRVYIDRYGRRGAEQGWAFTGDPQPIKRLADAIGFQYAYDPELRQYAHPAGLLFSRRRAVSPITFRRGVFPRDCV